MSDTMDDAIATIKKLRGIQRSIAGDVWPDGAILQCAKCAYSERITSEQAGSYLARGWPKHCGATMRCESGVSPSKGEATK